jgi:carbonic anhydrase
MFKNRTLAWLTFVAATALPVLPSTLANPPAHPEPAHEEPEAKPDTKAKAPKPERPGSIIDTPAAPSRPAPGKLGELAKASEKRAAEKNDKAADKQAEKSTDKAGEKNNDKNNEKKPEPAGKPAQAAEPSANAIDAAEALSMLKEGNARWVSGAVQHPNTDSARRESVAAGQKPFVTIVTCADSRVPVERLFDRGVGEVFVIRVAGNVAGDSETGTIEYGVGHLKTPLLVVMGHTRCGAVAAAADNADVHGKVASLVNRIKPAVERAKRNNPGLAGPDLAAATVRENVWQTMYDLFAGSSELRDATQTGRLMVVGAVYDLSTGKVEFMGAHPWQNEIFDALARREASPAQAPANKTEHADADGEHH